MKPRSSQRLSRNRKFAFVASYKPSTSDDDDDDNSISMTSQEVVELCGFSLTLLGYVCLPKPGFVVVAVSSWAAYVLYCRHFHRSRLSEWGFLVTPSLHTCSFVCLLLNFVAVQVMLVFRSAKGDSPPVHLWHMLIALLLYPLWGIAQQFFMQSILASRLAAESHSRVLVTVVASAVFGLLHWPNSVLVAATFVFNLFATPLFLKFRSIWPIGVSHGVVGTLFYYLVLDQDFLR
jgi:hypothetical protein